MTPAPNSAPRWFLRGDIDGFFGLALDNLIQVLLLTSLCSGVLGFSADMIYSRVLPGAALSLLVGNLFYAHQARRLQLRTGRSEVCALPYGINTVTLIGFVFLVMLPVRIVALGRGMSQPEASELAFQAGLIATVVTGVIEAATSWLVDYLRRFTPRAAMLSTLAGIAITFIAAGFLLKTFAAPWVTFLPFGAVLLTYFGRVRFPWGLPGGLVAVGVGTLLSWVTGFVHFDRAQFDGSVGVIGLKFPIAHVDSIMAGFESGYLVEFLPVIVPMGIFNVIGSLQNLESASAAGDDYPTVPSLVANGIGTVVGALFGSPFPTTIYIGHPGWKAMGARTGYSILNGVFFTVLGLTGTAAIVALFVPIEAGMAIVLWIGIVMVSQAFQATPRQHAPAVTIGLLPGLAAWGALLLKAGLRAGGVGTTANPFDSRIESTLASVDVAAKGLFALEQGFLVSSMIWAAMTVEIIERRLRRAAYWALAAAALSSVGLIHGFRYTMADTVQALGLHAATPFMWAYALLSLCLFGASYLPSEQNSKGNCSDADGAGPA